MKCLILTTTKSIQDNTLMASLKSPNRNCKEE